MAFLTLFRLLFVLVATSNVLADPNHKYGHFGGGQGGGNGQAGNNRGSSSAAVTTTTTAAAAGGAVTTTTTAAAAVTTTAASTNNNSGSNGGGNGGNGGNSGNSGSSSNLQLNPANVQTASDSDGGAIAEAGQSPSQTDPANFINFCTGQTLTNGTQVTGGSCNGVVMGQIPSKANMISSIITTPLPGDTVTANQNFTISVQVQGLEAGTFTNPNTAYYSAPQALSSSGLIIGHTHVTVQTLGNSINALTPPDPTTFMFFKGINDDGNGQGLLSAVVAGGLPAGIYRVCTMTAAANHQPVLMPIAQRGAQDDCTKFTVADGANSANPAANGGNQNGQQTTEKTAQTSGGAAFGGRRIRRYEKRY